MSDKLEREAAEYMRLFSAAVKFIQQRYPEWDGSVDNSKITLTGCANMMADWFGASAGPQVTSDLLRARAAECDSLRLLLHVSHNHIPLIGDDCKFEICTDLKERADRYLAQAAQAAPAQSSGLARQTSELTTAGDVPTGDTSRRIKVFVDELRMILEQDKEPSRKEARLWSVCVGLEQLNAAHARPGSEK